MIEAKRIRLRCQTCACPPSSWNTWARPRSGGDLVKCDSETTTQNDIDRGIVNMLVGFTPLKPAKFVILQIEQLAGQDES